MGAVSRALAAAAGPVRGARKARGGDLLEGVGAEIGFDGHVATEAALAAVLLLQQGVEGARGGGAERPLEDVEDVNVGRRS
jgi:hypothetical protein